MSCVVEPIEHDAATGLEINADTLRELFRGAALGMLDIIVDRNRSESRTVRLITAVGESVDLLLANFLSEILSSVQVDRFGVFDIEMGEIDENLAIAEISGQPGIPRGAFYTEIKEMAYHELDVHRDRDGKWRGKVIFDL